MKVIDLTADYQVKGTNVTLTNVIGVKQIGTSVVKLGSKILKNGDITNLPLGNGATLKGKTLKIKSIVSDVNDRSNKTTIKYKFKGGSKNQDFISAGTVDQHGDSIIYRANFKFV